MTKDEAIETLRANYPDACYGQLREAVDMAITALQTDGDCIGRRGAITIPVLPKEHRKYQTMNLDDAYELGWFDCQKCIEELPSTLPLVIHCTDCEDWLKRQSVWNVAISELPSIQPEPCADTVSRTAAIEAQERIMSDHPLDGYEDGRLLINALKALPSVQPEPCEDTISRADAIRVASGYCHPANVAEELAKLPSVQPVIYCRDCIHYDGRPCGIVDWWNMDDDFCSRAERRTDGQNDRC